LSDTKAAALVLGDRPLGLETLRDWERRPGRVSLAEVARERMAASVATVLRVVDSGRASYGINTGFGAFANKRISTAQLSQLQYNLVRSHACGVGTPLAPQLVRRVMLLKANSLAVGVSGIRPEVVDTMLALLNADVLPIIPGRGSVGASGDLAPLAHLALALIGEGEAMHGETKLEGPQVLETADCTPIRLAAKEGLALLNGTQLSLALAIDGLFRAETLLGTAITAGALSVEGLAGSYTPFDDRIHAARGLAPQRAMAARFRELLTESEIHSGHADCDRVQDPYSVRCMPQVYGAVAATLRHAREVLGAEANGVSDNPLVFGEDVLSGGNFHAAPIGFVADYMAIGVAELGNMSERRIDLLARRVNPSLQMFLTDEPGVESGFMIAHVTAAALASENKTLAHPASVDTIPTSAGQEDHVAMAPWAGHKLLAACENTTTILAIELLAAAHAIDVQAPRGTTPQLGAVHAAIREHAPFVRGDRRLDRDIQRLGSLLRDGVFEAPEGSLIR
jgi:histidine ammonia-lyase